MAARAGQFTDSNCKREVCRNISGGLTFMLEPAVIPLAHRGAASCAVRPLFDLDNLGMSACFFG